MKRTLVYGTATAIIAASLGGNLGLARCGRADQPAAGLYGPPIEAPQDDDDPVETVYGPPPGEYDEPIDEPIEDVYGPPIEQQEDIAVEGDTPDPDTEAVQPALYGPPAN